MPPDVTVTGTACTLTARAVLLLDVTAREPAVPHPGRVDFDDPRQFPPNPNGYMPITVTEPQTPVNEFNGPPE